MDRTKPTKAEGKSPRKTPRTDTDTEVHLFPHSEKQNRKPYNICAKDLQGKNRKSERERLKKMIKLKKTFPDMTS